MTKNKWLTFENRINYNVGVLNFKTKHRCVPHYIEKLFNFSCNRTYGLRSGTFQGLDVPYSRTKYMNMSLSATASRIWNNIPAFYFVYVLL